MIVTANMNLTRFFFLARFTKLRKGCQRSGINLFTLKLNHLLYCSSSWNIPKTIYCQSTRFGLAKQGSNKA